MIARILAQRRVVAGEDHVLKLGQRMRQAQGFLLQHIQSGAGQPAGSERGHESGFVHHRAARGIDQDGPGLRSASVRALTMPLVSAVTGT